MPVAAGATPTIQALRDPSEKPYQLEEAAHQSALPPAQPDLVWLRAGIHLSSADMASTLGLQKSVLVEEKS